MSKQNIKIDDNVKIPNVYDAYPLDTLEIGKSFTVPLGDRMKLNSAITSYRYKRKANNVYKKYKTKTEGDLLRCWRIE